MMPKLDELPDVLTVGDCARVLGIARNTAYEAVRRLELPAVKIGRRILVPKAALLRILDVERVVSTA
jgi:excisionase family DNA binding protein